MYNFILDMWVIGKADAAYVQSKVPTRITQDQCNVILTTTQYIPA